MESCLYEGRVVHRRRGSIEHRFSFPLFMLYLDLDELPRVFRQRWLWSTTRPALARFRREDHLGDPRAPLDHAVRELVAERIGRRPEGPVRLLTHLRYAGFGLNPVSFYYLFDGSGEVVEAVVAEVNNTPWGERHCYVLARGGEGDGDSRLEHCGEKAFHVSPFMGMDQTYDWSVGTPGEGLDLRIANTEAGAKIFDAALSMKRREISRASLARALVRYPFLTWQVAAGIYWQAFRLWSKGVVFHPHPRATGASMELVS